MPKLLITGWSRGGLGYVMTFLRRRGYAVSYTVDHQASRESVSSLIPQMADVEVSPYLVPFLDRPGLVDVPVVFVVRNPLRVFNSLYFHGLLHNERPTKLSHFLSRNLDDFMLSVTGRPGLAASRYLFEWVRLAYHKRADLRWARQEYGPQHLLQVCGMPVPSVLPYCAPDVSASNCQQTYTLERLPADGQSLVAQLLVKFGYNDTNWAPPGGHSHYVLPEWRN